MIRREKPQESSWRSARESEAERPRDRDQRPPERGARDFASLRDPEARKAESRGFERREERGDRGDRGDRDREIRRGPPGPPKEEGSWRSARSAASERPAEGGPDVRSREPESYRPPREVRFRDRPDESGPPRRGGMGEREERDYRPPPRDREGERERPKVVLPARQRKEEVDDEGFTKVNSRR